MSETKQAAPTLSLPLSVVGKMDVTRLLRELAVLDNFLKAAQVRQGGAPTQLPKTSKLLDEILITNKLNALLVSDRDQLDEFLQAIKKDAPKIHMSFSADPSVLVQQRLITWLRQNIHPHVLLQTGLLPTIGAGAVVRTTNKVFDFSLRGRFENQKELLLERLHASHDTASEEPTGEAA